MTTTAFAPTTIDNDGPFAAFDGPILDADFDRVLLDALVSLRRQQADEATDIAWIPAPAPVRAQAAPALPVYRAPDRTATPARYGAAGIAAAFTAVVAMSAAFVHAITPTL